MDCLGTTGIVGLEVRQLRVEVVCKEVPRIVFINSMTDLTHLVSRSPTVSQELKCNRWLQALRDVRDKATSLGESDDHVIRSRFKHSGVREFVFSIFICYG